MGLLVSRFGLAMRVMCVRDAGKSLAVLPRVLPRNRGSSLLVTRLGTDPAREGKVGERIERQAARQNGPCRVVRLVDPTTALADLPLGDTSQKAIL